jgi:hypothetical protein
MPGGVDRHAFIGKEYRLKLQAEIRRSQGHRQMRRFWSIEGAAGER